MGEEYMAIVEKAFSERWIDVVENKGNEAVLILREAMTQIHIFY